MQRSLVGCSPLGHKESDTTEQLTLSLSIILQTNAFTLESACEPRGCLAELHILILIMVWGSVISSLASLLVIQGCCLEIPV